MRSRLRRWLDRVPITTFGLGVATTAFLGERYFAEPEGDFMLRVLAYTCLALVVLSVVGVVVARLRWKRAQVGSHRPAVTGEAERGEVVAGEFSLLGRLVGLRTTVEWVSPAGPSARLAPRGSRVEERVRFDGRVGVDDVERRWTLQDPFGLARLRWSEPRAQTVSIAPWLGHLARCPALTSLAQGDVVSHPLGPTAGDRIDLRPYQPGDPLRLVAWKVYARTGELDVRVPERALAPHVRTAAYLVASPDDEASAAAAWVAVERGLLGPDWIFGADGAEPTADVDQARQAILRSAAHRDRSAAGLAVFLRELEKTGPLHVILFVPGRPGPWLESCAREAGPDFSVVIGVDDVRASAVSGRSWWRREDPDPGRRIVVEPAELQGVIDAFRRKGSGVVALRRTDGKVLAGSVRPLPGVAAA